MVFEPMIICDGARETGVPETDGCTAREEIGVSNTKAPRVGAVGLPGQCKYSRWLRCIVCGIQTRGG